MAWMEMKIITINIYKREMSRKSGSSRKRVNHCQDDLNQPNHNILYDTNDNGTIISYYDKETKQNVPCFATYVLAKDSPVNIRNLKASHQSDLYATAPLARGSYRVPSPYNGPPPSYAVPVPGSGPYAAPIGVFPTAATSGYHRLAKRPTGSNNNYLDIAPNRPTSYASVGPGSEEPGYATLRGGTKKSFKRTSKKNKKKRLTHRKKIIKRKSNRRSGRK